jgi:BASS family bile acid:Na+ symporter
LRAGRALAASGDRLADHIAPAAALAVLLALAAPSATLADRSDLLLATLVLFTAMGIDPQRLLGLRDRSVALIGLSIAPLLLLTGVAWLLSRPFSGAAQDGVLSLGLASSEVASVGLIALAGGDAVLALGVLTGSLIVSAVIGPLLAGVLAHTAGHAGGLHLLGRFALVVLAPLAGGLALRGIRPGIERAAGALNGLSALTVCVLLYAALSGVSGGGQLVQDVVGSLAFMIAAGALALLATHVVSELDAAAVALTTWLRDFAVAAALASQAFGSRAAGVAGIYGALMLLGGTISATLLRRRGAERDESGAPTTDLT